MYDQALQWALQMGVDIISMSWTFESQAREGDDEHETKFVKLIEKAVASKRVLIFGSVPDQGAGAKTNQVIPVGVDGVIRIGSATVYGETSSKNVHERPNFILPGENITLSTGEQANGSSFATAYAAGLAATVLYCLMARKAYPSPMPDDDQPTKALAFARTTKGMKTIFNILSGKNPNDDNEKGNFPRPYSTFNYEFGDSSQEKFSILTKIMNAITPSSSLQRLWSR